MDHDENPKTEQAIKERTTPATPGKYWARESVEERYFHMVVQVGGKTPFLRVNLIADFNPSEHVSGPIDPDSVVFGPPFQWPKVPMEDVLDL